MAKIIKRYRNNKGHFISKKESNFIERFVDALPKDEKPNSVIDFIKKLSPQETKEVAKKGNPQTGKLNRRWRNKKGHLISYKDIENIKTYYEENVADKTKVPRSIKDEVKKWDLDILKKFSDIGSKFPDNISIQYLVDALFDDGVEMTVEQRLSQAKEQKATVSYKGEKKTYMEILAIMKEDAENYKSDVIENGDNWYKTYVYLTYDKENNVLTYDPSLNDKDIISSPPTENEESIELRKKQTKWQKGRK